MNTVMMIGRLYNDPEVRYAQNGGMAVCRFGIAVTRDFKRDGEPDADFFNCVSFGKAAEFVGKYFHKGSPIAIQGELRNEEYQDQQGNNRRVTKIYVNKQWFVGPKEQTPTRPQTQPQQQAQQMPPQTQPVQQAAPQQPQQYGPQYQMPIPQNYQQGQFGDFIPDYDSQDEDMPF